MLNLLLTLALATTPQAKPATNTTCPVLGGAVDAKSKIVTVKGQDYRVCCKDCEAKLPKNPGEYLKEDGTPKNAGKPPAKMMPKPAEMPKHDGHMH
jgi:hypothetical protein